jgi:3D-(3,5/4)-trihydroxycyclohexane-1,2-dione acylhydrolase (decyclizing)
LADATGIPVADTQAGKGAISFEHPSSVGGIGSTGNNAANALAAEADVIIGVGTRYSDFTTASRTVFGDPKARFVNLNVLAFDAAKNSAEMVVTDARAGLLALTEALEGYRVEESYSQQVARLVAAWSRVTDECFHRDNQPLPAQTEVFGALNELMGDDDIIINAAGSMPGDLQALWRARTPRQYHLEYGYSCMGYEIPAAMGAKLAAPDSEVVAIVGDGSFQMLPQEIATIVSENLKVIIVLIQNHGFASIGALSESLGSQRFGTSYRMRDDGSDRLDGENVPIDLAGSARSFGADVLEVHTIEDFRAAYRTAAASPRTTLIYIETDVHGPNPPASAWWDVPVSQTARLESTRQAYVRYQQQKERQRHHL